MIDPEVLRQKYNNKLQEKLSQAEEKIDKILESHYFSIKGLSGCKIYEQTFSGKVFNIYSPLYASRKEDFIDGIKEIYSEKWLVEEGSRAGRTFLKFSFKREVLDNSLDKKSSKITKFDLLDLNDK